MLIDDHPSLFPRFLMPQVVSLLLVGLSATYPFDQLYCFVLLILFNVGKSSEFLFISQNSFSYIMLPVFIYC